MALPFIKRRTLDEEWKERFELYFQPFHCKCLIISKEDQRQAMGYVHQDLGRVTIASYVTNFGVGLHPLYGFPAFSSLV